MESMNGLLLHLAGSSSAAKANNHPLLAWTEQVASLVCDCESSVELYVDAPRRGGGILLRLLPRFLRTAMVHRKAAKWIWELKVRAHDVGDRLQRYGVTVLPADKSLEQMDASSLRKGLADALYLYKSPE